MEADAFQTTACFWLSVITLVGIGLNAALGWWWADPVAALGMTWFIGKEGAEAWRGESCECSATRAGEGDGLAAGHGCGCSPEVSCGGASGGRARAGVKIDDPEREPSSTA
jgi:hypothetical protein